MNGRLWGEGEGEGAGGDRNQNTSRKCHEMHLQVVCQELGFNI